MPGFRLVKNLLSGEKKVDSIVGKARARLRYAAFAGGAWKPDTYVKEWVSFRNLTIHKTTGLGVI